VQYRETRDPDLLDRLTERFIYPIVRGFYMRHGWRYPYIEEGDAINPAVTLGQSKINNYDPEKGSGLNYITKIAQRLMRAMNDKEAIHQGRFIVAELSGKR
jgi:hypothetical protein